ncbi:hypothetical protein GBA52_028820 [Prunus armeniaca]|nr:hypothetical protein GBA52_028820 [Prunus armeniaca]
MPSGMNLNNTWISRCGRKNVCKGNDLTTLGLPDVVGDFDLVANPGFYICINKFSHKLLLTLSYEYQMHIGV